MIAEHPITAAPHFAARVYPADGGKFRGYVLNIRLGATKVLWRDSEVYDMPEAAIRIARSQSDILFANYLRK